MPRPPPHARPRCRDHRSLPGLTATGYITPRAATPRRGSGDDVRGPALRARRRPGQQSGEDHGQPIHAHADDQGHRAGRKPTAGRVGYGAGSGKGVGGFTFRQLGIARSASRRGLHPPRQRVSADFSERAGSPSPGVHRDQTPGRRIDFPEGDNAGVVHGISIIPIARRVIDYRDGPVALGRRRPGLFLGA